jgi:hypothetical protein
MTKIGQIKSSVVTTLSRTNRRAHSLRRFRRIRVGRSSLSLSLWAAGSTEVKRVRDSIGRPNLIAMAILQGVVLTGPGSARYPSGAWHWPWNAGP